STYSYVGYTLERCEGMALISFLVSRGVLSPSDIYAGAETLHDIPLCDEVVEVINYYALAVTDESLYSRIYHPRSTDAKYSSETSVNNLVKDLENNGKPFMANIFVPGETHSVTIDDLIASGFYNDVEEIYELYKIDSPDWKEEWTDYKNHYVVVYGLEYGEWNYNNTTYTSRILICDNSSVDFDDSLCIYFTEEQTKAGNFDNQGYIPYYDTTTEIYGGFENPDFVLYNVGNSVSYTPSCALGDFNQDNVINSEDAALILQKAAMLGISSEDSLNVGQEYSADVNGDGKINSEDASWILQYSASVGSGLFKGELSEFIQQQTTES
ncbi:MAG: dockerin type I repeat-containing protein, partial [Oscillospiraceae bacterium]|nr:dockerin type I repeat-containing protein [Oscillospiraceae bacterium]